MRKHIQEKGREFVLVFHLLHFNITSSQNNNQLRLLFYILLCLILLEFLLINLLKK